jgi:hypothetical protein
MPIEYAREAKKQALAVTQKGRPVLALMPLPPHTDLENLAVTTHPTFQAIMQRAEARYRTEGGLSTEQVRRRLVARRAARRKR